ncbi:MAG TPA: lipid-A-disaccharide synthase [Rickettsiales bacterium]|nr:lipid-A-disaccharide synthase [Rickettsiales bacterium]
MARKFFIIAGEASGDVLGAKLIKEIKSQFGKEKLEFVGIGGKMMEKEGLHPIFPMSDLSIMGFVEVVPHISKLLKRIRQSAVEIIKQKPDFIVTIDSPDFNFRVLKKLQNFKSAKKIHVIAPSVWAYREKRAQKISQLCDLLLAILPFEPPYFTKYGLKTVFIGHPIMEDAPNMSQKALARDIFRNKFGFYEKDIVVYITPGSRISEVKKIFPEFIGAINLLKNRVENLSVVVAVIDKTKDVVEKMAKDFEVKYVVVEGEEKSNALFAADFALTKSGTNTFETLLYQLPMLVCYKVNSLTHIMAKFLLRIRFANLINLIMEREIIPELIQNDCYGENIATKLEFLIKNPQIAKLQIENSQIALKILGLNNDESAVKKAVREIIKL